MPSTLYECNRGQCFVNIPIVAWLFVPLALLNQSVAGLLFSAAGVMLLLAAVRRMARGTAAGAIVWLALLSGPIYYSVRIGNTTHMLLLALLVAFDRLAADRQAEAGVILAGASLLKPPLALFLPYFVLRRHVRAAVVDGGVRGRVPSPRRSPGSASTSIGSGSASSCWTRARGRSPHTTSRA